MLLLLFKRLDLEKREEEESIVVLFALHFDPAIEPAAVERLSKYHNNCLKLHIQINYWH